MESDIIVNNAAMLLTMRNSLFERDINNNLYWDWVTKMYDNKDDLNITGLNIFEYCFATKTLV